MGTKFCKSCPKTPYTDRQKQNYGLKRQIWLAVPGAALTIPKGMFIIDCRAIQNGTPFFGRPVSLTTMAQQAFVEPFNAFTEPYSFAYWRGAMEMTQATTGDGQLMGFDGYISDIDNDDPSPIINDRNYTRKLGAFGYDLMIIFADFNTLYTFNCGT